MSKTSKKLIKKNNKSIIKPHIIWSSILYAYLIFYKNAYSFSFYIITFIDLLAKSLLFLAYFKDVNLNAPGFCGVLFDLILVNYIIGFLSVYAKYIMVLYLLVIYSIYYEYKKHVSGLLIK